MLRTCAWTARVVATVLSSIAGALLLLAGLALLAIAAWLSPFPPAMAVPCLQPTAPTPREDPAPASAVDVTVH